MHLERIGRSVLDMITSKHEELIAKVSETEVDKWTKMVEMERMPKTNHCRQSITDRVQFFKP